MPVTLALGAALLLAAASGCDDGTVRGAGSIDVPKPAQFVMPARAGSGGAKAAGVPRGPR